MRFKNIGEEAHIFNIANMSPEEKLESDKALSRNISEARKRSKRDTCIYCGKQVKLLIRRKQIKITNM